MTDPIPSPFHRSLATIDEIVQRYAQGERNFSYIDVDDGADFSNLKLSGAIFDHSFISLANFKGAELKQVSFRNTNVKCNDFSNADLEGADFQGAPVEATCFAGANLKDARFTGAEYYGFTITEDQVSALLEDLCKPFPEQ